MIVFYSLVFNFKDLKDKAGDKLQRFTVFSWLGEEKGSGLIVLLICLGLFLGSFILGSMFLFMVSLITSVFLVVLWKKGLLADQVLIGIYVLYSLFLVPILLQQKVVG